MCRLLGIAANSPVNIEGSLLKGIESFVELSHKHRDGWGIGYLGDRLNGGASYAHIEKSPQPAYKDIRFLELIKKLSSPVFIIHLRDAKYGEVKFENTHPFYHKGWMFAHNGAIENYREIEHELAGIEFEGETDSERYFRLILKKAGALGDVGLGIRSAIEWLEINRLEGGRNFLLSDGERLYAYRHGRGLFFTIKETSTILPDQSHRIISIIIIASEPLTGDNWHDIDEDHLLVVDENLQITIEPILASAMPHLETR